MKNVMYLTRWLLARVLDLWTGNSSFPGSPPVNFNDGGMVIGLWTARSEDYTPEMSMDKLTEADFTGYARQTMTLAGAGHVYTNGELKEAIDTALASFESTSTTSQLVKGAFLSDNVTAGSGNLAGFCEFLTPRSIGPGMAVFNMAVKCTIPVDISNGYVITI